MNHTIQSHSLSLKSLTLIIASLSFAACAGTRGASQAKSSSAQPAPVVVTTTRPAPTPTPDRAAVRDALAARRQVQIDRLRAYSAAGVFPKNHEQPGMLNIFIDDEGSICAAANLMWQDGLEDLVREQSISDNYLRLVTVNDGPLLDWMLGSGLTQAEIDRIQEPYSFVGDEPIAPTEPPMVAEVERLQAHFAVVLAELEANQAASLDAATDRLMANPTLVATL